MVPVPADDAAATGGNLSGIGTYVGAASVLAGGGLIVAPGADFRHFVGWNRVADGLADFIEPIFAAEPGDVSEIDRFVEAESGC